MKKNILSLVLIFGLCLIYLSFFSTKFVYAQNSTEPANHLLGRLSDVASGGGFETDVTKASIPVIVGYIIGIFINISGITFIVLIILAGYRWMTANGSEDKVEKSKDTIRESIIGLIISISAYAIWNFIYTSIVSK